MRDFGLWTFLRQPLLPLAQSVEEHVIIGDGFLNKLDEKKHFRGVHDRMHALLVKRADELMGCTENSPEEAELAALTNVIEAYESQRWPEGKIPGSYLSCPTRAASRLSAPLMSALSTAIQSLSKA